MNNDRFARIAAAATLAAMIACLAPACSDSTSGPDDVTGDSSGDVASGVSIAWAEPDALPATADPGADLVMTAVVTRDGAPAADTAVDAEVLLGGGALDAATGLTDADGIVSFTWRQGLMPVRAAIRLSVTDEAVFVDHVVQVQATAAIAPATAAGVEELLAAAGVDGSTEGLAFDDSGNLWLAAPGYLIRVRMSTDLPAAQPGPVPPGAASVPRIPIPVGPVAELLPVGGDGLEAPLGMAWDYLRRCLWVADKASIRRVTIDEDAVGGPVATSAAAAELTGLVTPNSVAIRDNRHVYFTDSCTGNVYRFAPDDDPVAMQVVAGFDLAEKGGPNGLAFDDSGRLWVTTENVGLLCPDSGVDVTATVGGLYVLDIGETLPVPEYTARLEGFAMFGDGLAFDADGNLYVIFDRFDGFNLLSSAVWLVPETGEPVMVASVAIPGGATSPDRLIANMAWGHDDFGPTTVWFSLLAVPLVAAERGAMTADFAIPGRSLLPADLPE